MPTQPETTAPFTARGKPDTGEVMVTSPSGQVTFLSFWQFCRFTWDAVRAGRKIKVQDD